MRSMSTSLRAGDFLRYYRWQSSSGSFKSRAWFDWMASERAAKLLQLVYSNWCLASVRSMWVCGNVCVCVVRMWVGGYVWGIYVSVLTIRIQFVVVVVYIMTAYFAFNLLMHQAPGKPKVKGWLAASARSEMKMFFKPSHPGPSQRALLKYPVDKCMYEYWTQTMYRTS